MNQNSNLQNLIINIIKAHDIYILSDIRMLNIRLKLI
jgi:hypothetical protein